MDVVTFGSATWDSFLKIPKDDLIKNKIFSSGEGFRFNLGSKIDLADMYFGFGGGGVNVAFTFKLQGFDVAYCGSVGSDVPGKEIVAELKRMGIDTSFVQKNIKSTNSSVILNSSDEQERTVLAYRGASEMLDKNQIDWKKIKASWFYLAPLSGKLKNITEDIVNFAEKNGIKVAMNLGNSQIALGEKKLRKILKKVNVLLLNQEEGSLLTGVKFEKTMEILKELDNIHPGINVITRGSEGAMISDSGTIYEVSTLKTKVVDATGAGDAFGSSFVSGLLRSNMDIEWSARLAIANSVSAIKIKGATTGLLGIEDDFMKIGKKVKIRKL